MKISLRWLCDHIAVKWTDINVGELVQAFNTKTAEIEKVIHYKLDIASFTLGMITEIDTQFIKLSLVEWGEFVQMPVRTDAVMGQWYLVKRVKDIYSWASYADVQSEHEKLLGAFSIPEDEVKSGAWRNLVETEDYIFEVDNKSITHRPDMWGHRGIAREVSALLGLAMVEEKDLALSGVVEEKEGFYKPSSQIRALPISLNVTTPACQSLAVLRIKNIKNQPSVLKIAMRLVRVDSKFHNFIVDATNYVMFDVGHPMHAFDLQKIAGHSLSIGMACQDEELELLDGTRLILTEKDVVVRDGEKVLSLAGIKGGKYSGISDATTDVILEAACFDAATIRLSSMHHKVRTDASARFEKSLDPYSAVETLECYKRLLKEHAVSYEDFSETVSVWGSGKKTQPPIIFIDQFYIEGRLGVKLTDGFVKQTLEKIAFKVDEKKDGLNTLFAIQVPTFRATKDVAIKEDIVEEVGRFYGYTLIPMSRPYPGKQPKGVTWFDRQSRLKECLAQQACMDEVQNYALFDNDFISKLNWTVSDAITLKNPLSAQRTTMVTSLIPHLLQNIDTNMGSSETLAFFEWARIWHNAGNGVQEQQVLAGVWYERKEIVDFYACKEYLKSLFRLLDCDVLWEKLEASTQWESAHQVAQLTHNGRLIGKAGKVSNLVMHKLGGGDAFVFELDADFIKEYVPVDRVFKLLPKYQATTLDITVMVNLETTVAQLTRLVTESDTKIFEVILLDVFRKPEWIDRKSVTLRFFVRDETKTMEKQEIEAVYQSVVKRLQPSTIQEPL